MTPVPPPAVVVDAWSLAVEFAGPIGPAMAAPILIGGGVEVVAGIVGSWRWR